MSANNALFIVNHLAKLFLNSISNLFIHFISCYLGKAPTGDKYDTFKLEELGEELFTPGLS